MKKRTMLFALIMVVYLAPDGLPTRRTSSSR